MSQCGQRIGAACHPDERSEPQRMNVAWGSRVRASTGELSPAPSVTCQRLRLPHPSDDRNEASSVVDECSKHVCNRERSVDERGKGLNSHGVDVCLCCGRAIVANMMSAEQLAVFAALCLAWQQVDACCGWRRESARAQDRDSLQAIVQSPRMPARLLGVNCSAG